MAKLDETRPFLPVNIAVLTVSDTRTLETDTSGATLAERIAKSGHRVAERAIAKDEPDLIEAPGTMHLGSKPHDVLAHDVSDGPRGLMAMRQIDALSR